MAIGNVAYEVYKFSVAVVLGEEDIPRCLLAPSESSVLHALSVSVEARRCRLVRAIRQAVFYIIVKFSHILPSCFFKPKVLFFVKRGYKAIYVRLPLVTAIPFYLPAKSLSMCL